MAEYPANLARMHPPMRLTLLAALCHVRHTEITDSPVELFIQLVLKINTRAEKKVDKELTDELKKVRGKEAMMLRVAEASLAQPSGTVRQVIFPVVSEKRLKALAAEAAANEAKYKARVRTVLRSAYSPEYDPAAHQALRARLAAVPHQVMPLDNGTGGMRRFGDLAAFQHLDRHAAAVLQELMGRHPRGLLIAIDQPFAGLGPLLQAPTGWRLLYLPRSSADHHADPERAAWEQHGLDGWTALGAAFGVISTHMRTLLTGKGVPAEQIIDVPGGLTAADRIPLAAAPPLPGEAGSGFLLSMGRAQPYKGFDDLLDALRLLSDTGVRLPHLLLAAVTDGPTTAYQHHLRRRVLALGLSATLWARFDPGLPGLLHHPALRAVIVPSRSEPLGRIPLEAFAAGAGPVVATTAGGLAETVIDNVTGFCAAPGDPRSLAWAINRALTAPAAEVARLRQAGEHLVAGRDYTSCITGVLAALSPWATGAAAAKP